MRRSKILISVLLIVTVLAVSACGGQSAKTGEQTAAADKNTVQTEPGANRESQTAEEKFLTLDELAAFNGKDGAKAYIAVDGIVYDVTDVPMWKNGKHNGFEAGQELSDAIKSKSPHGVAKLKDLPVVGRLK